jgi:hypothetical protein
MRTQQVNTIGEGGMCLGLETPLVCSEPFNLHRRISLEATGMPRVTEAKIIIPLPPIREDLATWFL